MQRQGSSSIGHKTGVLNKHATGTAGWAKDATVKRFDDSCTYEEKGCGKFQVKSLVWVIPYYHILCIFHFLWFQYMIHQGIGSDRPQTDFPQSHQKEVYCLNQHLALIDVH